jgi:hypothetical protein
MEAKVKLRDFGRFDLAVVGGGSTGVCAAVRAARLGLKVCIIEKSNCFGGVATNGLVNVWHTLYDTKMQKEIIGGITQQIEDILQIHQYGIEHRNEGDDSQDGMRVYITYAMADGTYRQRVYNINYNTDTGRSVKKYLSSPELVLGKIYTGQWIPEEINVWDLCITDPAEVRSLTDAIIADCLAGDLGQNWYYTNGSDYTFWIEISAGSSDDVYLYQSIQASSFAKNVVSWLENSKHSDIWEYMLKDYTK